MIKGLAISTVWVLDQDRAKEFYTEKLGLEVRTDMTMGEGGMRWLTVGSPNQPDVEFTLMVPGGPAMDPESAEMLRKLVTKGALGAGVLTTDDIHGDYKKLKDRGVEFLQEPQERPYGTEALFRDDSGNWFSFTQPREGGLDMDQDWSC
ncbi:MULTISPECIES: VOC family protein [Streptomyces]|uniref:VOC family protein n=1 Tax=Streptomyces violaceus TaxID=1936 RepID=A0ABY9U8I6_STRVL|nr:MULTISPECIES: VOC family protein [Streptomyces]WND19120.1 VOC family protein [Streptomyces janthinus]WNF64142.1 VOC family protein [Streptomyces sp. CGMCC 4.1456]GGT00988.1 lyase [Streptomyces janthinus]